MTFNLICIVICILCTVCITQCLSLCHRFFAPLFHWGIRFLQVLGLSDLNLISNYFNSICTPYHICTTSAHTGCTDFFDARFFELRNRAIMFSMRVCQSLSLTVRVYDSCYELSLRTLLPDRGVTQSWSTDFLFDFQTNALTMRLAQAWVTYY